VFYNYKNNPEHLPVFDSTFIYPLCIDLKNNLWYIHRPQSTMMCYNLSTHLVTSTELITDNKKKPVITDVETIFLDSKQQQWLSTWDLPLFFKPEHENIYRSFSHDEKMEHLK
jgi:hypothetical protein